MGKGYEAFIMECAQLADSARVDLFCIGTELDKAAMQRPDFWRGLIRKIRSTYRGPLTCCANWNSYENIGFWGDLEYIGISAYFPISDEKSPSFHDAMRGWKPYAVALESFRKKYLKPVLFAELGYKSTEYAGSQPWLDPNGHKPDDNAQANLYQAAFTTFWQRDWFKGIFIMNWYNKSMNRRQFLKSASALALAAHEGLALSSPKNAARIANNDVPRLLRLRLLTAAPLAQMKTFYCDLLGLPLIEEKAEEFTLAGGQTSVTFAQAQSEHGEPFYHVAFNIPENKILGAHDWQKPRTPLDRINANLRDPEMPEDVVHFRHWNAHSIFFWDPAGNLIEYIARHDLKNSAAGAYSAKDILYASEIAFISEDVTNTALAMENALELEQYRGGNDRFRALGDEHGLLLVIIRGRRWGYEKKAPPTGIFPTIAEIRGAKPAQFAIAGYPYEIVAK